MAMKAVGWLSNNLGWNISGRSQQQDPQQHQQAPSSAEPPPVASPTPLEQYMSNVSNIVFGGGAGSAASSNPLANIQDDPQQQQQALVDDVEHAELDEQGLPKTRNWYYFDEALNRWNVHPNAPASVKAEFAERLRQEEEEKNKAMRFPEPPPPPPPSFNPAAVPARSPLVPQYAVPTYFNEKQD